MRDKEPRLNQTYDLIETIKSDPIFLDFIITGNESWCFAYDAGTSAKVPNGAVQTCRRPKNFDLKNQG